MMMFKIVNYNYNQPNIWEIKVYLEINIFPYHRYCFFFKIESKGSGLSKSTTI